MFIVFPQMGGGGGKAPVLEETTIESLLSETTKTVTPPEGVDGFNKVTVTHAPVETLTEATITENGETTITPSEGYDATCGVKVNVQVGSSSEYSDADGMKYGKSSIESFPDNFRFAPRTGENCKFMFDSCYTLATVPLFDTSNVTNMSYMIYYCSRLTTVPLFDTSNVTNMSYMFYYCRKLTTVPLFDTSNVTDMSAMFDACSALTTVPQFDTSKVTDMNSMFNECSKLTSLGGFTGLKVDLKLSDSPLLTHDSLMNVINEAADVTASPKTLTLGTTNLAKLTDEEKAIATNKGWTLA